MSKDDGTFLGIRERLRCDEDEEGDGCCKEGPGSFTFGGVSSGIVWGRQQTRDGVRGLFSTSLAIYSLTKHANNFKYIKFIVSTNPYYE